MPSGFHRAVCLAALLVTAGCDVKVRDDGVSLGVASGRASDVFARTYTLPEDGRLEVTTARGAIDIGAADGPSIEIRVERDARARSDAAAREALQSVEIVDGTTGGVVRVEARDTTGGGPGRRSQVSLRTTVRLPPGLTASFETRNGQVRLDGVSGLLTVATANGGIVGSMGAGGISASVVNGRVQLSLASLTAPSDITVLNGSIRLALPAGAGAELRAAALNGRVTVDEAFVLTASSSGAGAIPGQTRVSGTLNGGGPSVSVQATNGSVRIAAANPGGDTAP
jgi:hypothetical protein